MRNYVLNLSIERITSRCDLLCKTQAVYMLYLCVKGGDLQTCQLSIILRIVEMCMANTDLSTELTDFSPPYVTSKRSVRPLKPFQGLK